MVLWLGFAVLAAAVVWAVTRPLVAAPPAAAAGEDTGLAVYRDQLSEIESEHAQGLIAGADAKAARVEVARRLMRRAEETEHLKATGAAHAARGRSFVLWAAAALPVVALGLYLIVGSPGLPGRRYAARLSEPVAQASASDLVAKVEAHLRQQPDDGRGWDVLAPVYMSMGDFREAADAFDRAIRLLGESPKRLAGFARASIMVANGVVGEPARRAYEKLHALNDKAVEPQVWLAIAKEQDGDLAAAAADYKRLLAAEGAGEPWHGVLSKQLESVTEKLGEAPAADAAQRGEKSAPGTAPAVDAGSMAEIQSMPPAERQQVIERMVEGLAARLKRDGKDLKGWLQLVRAYVVLGRMPDASTALAEARSNFAGDEKSLAQLQALAQDLGIGS